MAKVNPVPEGYHTVTPFLNVNGANEALAFYKKAFGAEERFRMPGPDGKIMHASISLNGSSVMLVDENPQYGLLSPRALSGTPVTIHLVVEDVDASTQRANASPTAAAGRATASRASARAGAAARPGRRRAGATARCAGGAPAPRCGRAWPGVDRVRCRSRGSRLTPRRRWSGR